MKGKRPLRTLVRVVVVGLVVAAVATELSKPKEERTWQGKVGGLVPYDFRMPTLDRIRSAYWNPESDSLFNDRAFGVGWAINFHRVKVLLEGVFGGLMGAEPAQTSIRMADRVDLNVQD